MTDHDPQSKPVDRLSTAAPVPAGNGQRAAAVLAERLAKRQHWPTDQQVEATITEAAEAWAE